MTPRDVIRERLLSKRRIDDNGCWIWTGYCNTRRNGYGMMNLDRMPQWVHRISYELHVGPITDGLHLDHLCRVTACFNPAHLEPVTCAENSRRGFLARFGGNCCARGHEFTAENTYLRPDGKGRQCRECIRLRTKPRTPEQKARRRALRKAGAA